MSRLNKLILNQSKIDTVIGTNSGYICRCMGVIVNSTFDYVEARILVQKGGRLPILRDCLYDKIWETLDE